MRDRDVVERLVCFAGRLRDRGVDISMSDEIDGAAVLLLVDRCDRGEVRDALRTALKIRRSDWDTFDELFQGFWTAEDRPARAPDRPSRAPDEPFRPRTGRGSRIPRWRWMQAIMTSSSMMA